MRELLLRRAWLYRLWQAPFVSQKLAPILSWGIPRQASLRILDIGCGPGTNASTLGQSGEYIGIDIEENYIRHASKHFEGRFEVRDATTELDGLGKFDVVVMNSLMHHIDDHGVQRLLGGIPQLLGKDGFVHILDLVRAPRSSSIAGLLMRLDRGQHARTPDEWTALVQRNLHVVHEQEFTVTVGTLQCWHMIHIVAALTPSSHGVEANRIGEPTGPDRKGT